MVRVTPEGCIETVSGTIYSLGAIDPEYDKRHPGAKEQLFAVLRKIEALDNKMDEVVEFVMNEKKKANNAWLN